MIARDNYQNIQSMGEQVQFGRWQAQFLSEQPQSSKGQPQPIWQSNCC